MISWTNFTPQDRKKIRDAYEPIMKNLKAGNRRDVYAIWPHNWTEYMSPIEKNVWQDIRSYGLPLYPQVPCGKYFIDFADPCEGIAIEVDGKQWHLDTEKDMQREEYIKAHGFPHLTRITGNRTFGTIDHERWGDERDDYQPDDNYAEMFIVELWERYQTQLANHNHNGV